MPPTRDRSVASALVRDAQRGDVASQTRLHDLLSRELSEYVERKSGPALRRHVSTVDLCQEAFLRAFRVIDVLPEDASVDEFKGLLFQHAAWVMADKGNGAREYNGESAFAGRLEEALSDRRDGDSKGPVTRADERRWLESLLERLDPGQAAVIRLRVDGFSFVDIAERLGIDKDAARKRYLRGAARLRELAQSGRG